MGKLKNSIDFNLTREDLEDQLFKLDFEYEEWKQTRNKKDD